MSLNNPIGRIAFVFLFTCVCALGLSRCSEVPNAGETAATRLAVADLSSPAAVRRGLASVFVLRVNGARAGHCWVVSMDGDAVTANHVLGPEGGVLTVDLADGHRLRASIVRRDDVLDLAVLRLPSGQRYAPLEVAPANALVGARVTLLAAQRTPAPIASTGFVASDAGEPVFRPKAWDYWITQFVTGPTYSTSSGAPWVDDNGKVVGVQLGTVLDPDRSAAVGVGFISPAADVGRFVSGEPRRSTPSLRVEFGEVTKDASTLAGELALLEGIWVHAAASDSPLTAAGVPLGARIVSVDDVETRSIRGLLETLSGRAAGQRVRLSVTLPDHVTTSSFSVELSSR